MAINVTPIPRLTVLAAPAFTLGTASSAGSALTAVSSDSTILTYDTTVPGSVLEAAATGSQATAARRDHGHNATGIAATAAEMVTATSTTVFPTALTTQNNPGVLKASVQLLSNGALGDGTLNIASVTDSGTGDWTVVFTTDFADTNVQSASSNSENNSTARVVCVTIPAVGSSDVNVYSGGSPVDRGICAMYTGLQS
jgi:hypothetical protein